MTSTGPSAPLPDPIEEEPEDDEPGPPAYPLQFEFTYAGEPRRLDIFLAEQMPEHSRAFLQKLIEEGRVTVTPASREIKPALKLPSGACVKVIVPPPSKVDLTPQDIPIRIIFEDPHLAVIDKPAGITVHPAPHQLRDTMVNALLFHLKDLSSIGGVERPGIVHRLDKDTSGVLVVAKDDSAHHGISAQFKDRTIRKTYLTIVRGEPEHWEGQIDLPLGKSYSHSKRQMVRMDGTGRDAVTDYRVLEKYRGYALIECYPRTGRTHQIRVHFASLRLPVACDKLYGREGRVLLSDLREKAAEAGEQPLLERQALHAASIAFRHPISNEEMAFNSPLHPDMHAFLKALEKWRAIRDGGISGKP